MNIILQQAAILNTCIFLLFIT